VGLAAGPVGLLQAPLPVEAAMGRWEGGRLKDFRPGELRALVGALAPDSPQRRAALRTLTDP